MSQVVRKPTVSEESTIPPPPSSVDPKLMKLLAEYLHSERAENGWRTHLREQLKEIQSEIEKGRTATQTIADKVFELSTEFEHHIKEEQHAIEKIHLHLSTHKEWKAAVDDRLKDLGDWDVITGQYVLDELKAKRDSDRARKARSWKFVWWVLGVLGVLASNAGTAYISQCSHPSHDVPAKK